MYLLGDEMDKSASSRFVLFASHKSLINDERNLHPRTGKFHSSGRKSISTPNFFSLTSRGVIPHLTPDSIAATLQLDGALFALEDYIEKATKDVDPPIVLCPSRQSNPLHTFTGLPSEITTLLTPRRVPAVPAPAGNSNSSISLFTSVGFQPLTGPAYSEYVRKLRPDIAVALGDVSYGSVIGAKRQAKMGDRSSAWLDLLIGDLHSTSSSTAIFAPILPASYHLQHEYLNYLTDELTGSVAGLAFYDSDLLQDMPASDSTSVLPRLSLDHPPSPLAILRQVFLGMDLFAIPFIDSATNSGLALVFQLEKPSSQEALDKADGGGALPLSIDLYAPIHARSKIPLHPTCPCYACKTHHRAYIHHLLSAKEMLGWNLLQIHNHATMVRFFESIRQSIEAGTLESKIELFGKKYETDINYGSAQGPRVRGYQFKSTGSGDVKKNKPAWGSLGVEEPHELNQDY